MVGNPCRTRTDDKALQLSRCGERVVSLGETLLGQGPGKWPLTTQDACAQLCNRSMARPKQPVTRDHQLNLSLTCAEYKLLQTRADAVGLRLTAYARSVLLQQEVQRQAISAASRYDRLVYQQWARVGSNLNQVARQLNSFAGVSAQDVEAVLSEIRALISRDRA